MDDQQVARGRFAPSPTGLVHLGNARTALATWLSIRKQHGVLVWRIEDLDPPREMEGAANAAMRDIRWLGLDWDEGPDLGGPHEPYIQSLRYDIYDQALSQLAHKKRLFPCRLSRRDIQEIASAPHGVPEGPAYPAALRPVDLPDGWFISFANEENPEAAIRLFVEPGIITFDDLVFGRVKNDVSETVGDFVLKRRDGLFAYQLAVVVDDVEMKISEVVRGSDLLESTPRQIHLSQALGAEPPTYAHVPMVVDHEGAKLSKRNASLTLEMIRESGATPEQVVGYLAFTLNLVNHPTRLSPNQLIDIFDWARIPKFNTRLPRDIEAIILNID